MTGNAPMKVTDEAITISHKDLEGENGLSGIEAGLGVSSRSSSPESELYKIMYENAKEEAREYKRKYEDALNDKHKAEIELAGSKSSGLGEIAQGLAGFAPMLLGAGTSSPAPLGEAQPHSQSQAQVAKKADVRLQAIVKHYSTLQEDEKEAVYSLLVKVFSDMEKIGEIVSLLD
jgi:NADH dehydrogenase/NADH:ubiquinone oxidoreductase subunit G